MGMVRSNKFEGEFLVEINEIRAVGTSLSLHLSCVCLLRSLASSLPPQDPPTWAPATTVAGPQPDLESEWNRQKPASLKIKLNSCFSGVVCFSFNGDRRAVENLLSKILSFLFA